MREIILLNPRRMCYEELSCNTTYGLFVITSERLFQHGQMWLQILDYINHNTLGVKY